jgi:hypothetical protein
MRFRKENEFKNRFRKGIFLEMFRKFPWKMENALPENDIYTLSFIKKKNFDFSLRS